MDLKRLVPQILLILIWLSPLVYLAFVYPDLKQMVPIHFDLSGKVNGYGSKHMLMYSVIFLCGITAGVYALIKFLPKIDPRKSVGMSPAFLNKIGITLVIFLSAINFMLIYSSASGGFRIEKLFAPLAGCFFIYMGNLMHSVKPNYFVGIRVPWTLHDPGTVGVPLIDLVVRYGSLVAFSF